LRSQEGVVWYKGWLKRWEVVVWYKVELEVCETEKVVVVWYEVE